MSIRSMNAGVLGPDVIARGALVEAVGQPARVESVLQLARSGVVALGAPRR